MKSKRWLVRVATLGLALGAATADASGLDGSQDARPLHRDEQDEDEPGVATNTDYYKWRRTVIKANWTDLQKKRFCDTLLYKTVKFVSKVSRVDEDGKVFADMDDDFLSVDDVVLAGMDEDRAARLKRGQKFHYTGTISVCKAKEFTLLLGISL